MAETKIGYFGAAVDSALTNNIAGSVKDPTKPGIAGTDFRPAIYIYDRRKDVALLLERNFPGIGRVIPHKEGDVTKGWIWRPHGARRSLQFLRHVREGVKVKQPQVDLLIEFFSLKDRERFARGGRLVQRRIQEEEMARQLWVLNGQPNEKIFWPSAPYIAGRFDMEGTQTVMKAHGKLDDINIRFSGVHTGWLQGLANSYEGTTFSSGVRTKKFQSDTYHWYARGEIAAEVMENIKRHLVLRKELADLLLKFHSERGHLPHNSLDYYTPKDFTQYNNTYQRRVANNFRIQTVRAREHFVVSR